MIKDKFLLKHSVLIAFILVVIGVTIIIVFMCISPFNDWSGESDATLFAQYGDFIGGLIGTLFSLAAFLLLFKTLRAQQETLNNQKDDSIIQKEAFEKERFESTFFNLLNVQQIITNDIKAYFKTIEGLSNERVHVVSGREFFMYARSELSKINNSIFSSKYSGTYDKSEIEDIEHYISELYDSQSHYYTHPHDAEQEEADIIQDIGKKYANKFYGISKINWDNIHTKDKKIKIKYVYYFFFRKFDYAIGHYFRNLYHILKFIKMHETHELNKSSNNKQPEIVMKKYNKYAQFIQAQMSTNELMLLYYNCLCFPKLLELVKKYGILENLAVNNLVDSSHYDENITKLKNSNQLFDLK